MSSGLDPTSSQGLVVATAIGRLGTPERADHRHRIAAEASRQQRVGRLHPVAAHVGVARSEHRCVGGEVQQRGERLAVVVARLENSDVGVHDLVGSVVVELVGQKVAGRRGAVVQVARPTPLVCLDDRVDGLVEHELAVTDRYPAPHAYGIWTAMGVVGLDHDVGGLQRAPRSRLHRLAHVDQTVGAVAVGHEPALDLDVGECCRA
jgi:hypothetical protein